MYQLVRMDGLVDRDLHWPVRNTPLELQYNHVLGNL